MNENMKQMSKRYENQVLKQFHTRHPRIIYSIMRFYVYRPWMNFDVEERVKYCQECTLSAKLAAVKVQTWPKTSLLWPRLHVDSEGPEKGFYDIIIVDSFTKWLLVIECWKVTLLGTIIILRELFSRFGIPDTIVTDNGTSFTVAKFEEFCKGQTIKNIMTPPYCSRSNGLAERIFEKIKKDGIGGSF